MPSATRAHTDPQRVLVNSDDEDDAPGHWTPEDLQALSAAAGVRVLRLRPGARVPDALGADPRVAEALEAVRSAGGPRSLTVTHDVDWPGTHDGQARTTFTRAPGAFDDGGVVLVMSVDTTLERAHERQWQALEGWLASLGEALPFDLWIVDRAGRCVLLSPSAEERLGAVLGRPLEELPLPEGWRQSWRSAFERALEGAASREAIECSLGGVPRSIVRVVSPVRVEGRVQGVLAVDLDVTELKDVEARLQASLEELRRAQDGLVQRRELAALGEMAAVVAHEIRNPLGAIANVAALLRRQPTGLEAAELQGILEDEVARLDALVRALLDFVRPLVPDPELRPLAPVLEDALQRELAAAGATEIDAPGPPVRGTLRLRVLRSLDPDVEVEMDAPLLRVAMEHVLRNALQALAASGGERTLSLSIRREGARALVTVRDSGPGIAPEIRGRLFQPFVTTRTSGSGLGLPVVRRIVEAHRGGVSLQDVPAGGAVCVFSLPTSR